MRFVNKSFVIRVALESSGGRRGDRAGPSASGGRRGWVTWVLSEVLLTQFLDVFGGLIAVGRLLNNDLMVQLLMLISCCDIRFVLLTHAG